MHARCIRNKSLMISIDRTIQQVHRHADQQRGDHAGHDEAGSEADVLLSLAKVLVRLGDLHATRVQQHHSRRIAPHHPTSSRSRACAFGTTQPGESHRY